ELLSARLGQPFVIGKRPGGSANLAAEAAARAPADGYTLLTLTTTNMVNAALFDKLSFSLNRDFAMVAGLNRAAFRGSSSRRSPFHFPAKWRIFSADEC